MFIVHRIIGSASDRDIAERLHALTHRNAVEYIQLKKADTARRRQRVTTDKGTVCGIALERDTVLSQGAVLKLDETGAIVVRVEEQSWLRLRARDAASALELGYNAGNLHWRVRFDDGDLLVAMEGPREDYLARIDPLLATARVIPDEERMDD
ncbi:MAG: urease accessory protein UreE [Alphaproteobacteria bacterium]|jgi:urease accessory protein